EPDENHLLARRGEMPAGSAGRHVLAPAHRRVVGGVARRTRKPRGAVAVRPAHDALTVDPAVVELQRRVPEDVAILAARVLQDRAHGLEGGDPLLLFRRAAAASGGEEERGERGAAHHATPNGSRRRRLPVAPKYAFATAGPIGGTPGSPIPPGGSELGTMCTS